jgi:hypothetical protein
VPPGGTSAAPGDMISLADHTEELSYGRSSILSQNSGLPSLTLTDDDTPGSVGTSALRHNQHHPQDAAAAAAATAARANGHAGAGRGVVPQQLLQQVSILQPHPQQQPSQHQQQQYAGYHPQQQQQYGGHPGYGPGVQSPLQPVTSYMPQGPLHQQYYGGAAVLPPLQGQMSAYGIPQQQGQYMATPGALQPAPTYQPSYVPGQHLQQQMQGLRVAGGVPQYPQGAAAAGAAGVYHHHPAMQQQALALASATAASAAGAGRQGVPGGLPSTAAAAAAAAGGGGGGGGEGVPGPAPHRDVFSSSSSAWQIDPTEIALGPRIGIGSYGEVGGRVATACTGC